jgi:hypothetical protein
MLRGWRWSSADAAPAPHAYWRRTPSSRPAIDARSSENGIFPAGCSAWSGTPLNFVLTFLLRTIYMIHLTKVVRLTDRLKAGKVEGMVSF